MSKTSAYVVNIFGTRKHVALTITTIVIFKLYIDQRQINKKHKRYNRREVDSKTPETEKRANLKTHHRYKKSLQNGFWFSSYMMVMHYVFKKHFSLFLDMFLCIKKTEAKLRYLGQ